MDNVIVPLRTDKMTIPLRKDKVSVPLRMDKVAIPAVRTDIVPVPITRMNQELSDYSCSCRQQTCSRSTASQQNTSIGLNEVTSSRSHKESSYEGKSTGIYTSKSGGGKSTRNMKFVRRKQLRNQQRYPVGILGPSFGDYCEDTDDENEDEKGGEDEEEDEDEDIKSEVQTRIAESRWVCCHACRQRVVGKRLEANGQIFHMDCFRCTMCKCSLSSVPFTVDINSYVYCVPHFIMLFAPKCSICGNAISPTMSPTVGSAVTYQPKSPKISAENSMENQVAVRIVTQTDNYHPTCFLQLCDNCGIRFHICLGDDKTIVSRTTGSRLCAECLQNKFNEVNATSGRFSNICSQTRPSYWSVIVEKPICFLATLKSGRLGAKRKTRITSKRDQERKLEKQQKQQDQQLRQEQHRQQLQYELQQEFQKRNRQLLQQRQPQRILNPTKPDISDQFGHQDKRLQSTIGKQLESNCEQHPPRETLFTAADNCMVPSCKLDADHHQSEKWSCSSLDSGMSSDMGSLLTNTDSSGSVVPLSTPTESPSPAGDGEDDDEDDEEEEEEEDEEEEEEEGRGEEREGLLTSTDTLVNTSSHDLRTTENMRSEVIGRSLDDVVAAEVCTTPIRTVILDRTFQRTSQATIFTKVLKASATAAHGQAHSAKVPPTQIATTQPQTVSVHLAQAHDAPKRNAAQNISSVRILSEQKQPKVQKLFRNLAYTPVNGMIHQQSHTFSTSGSSVLKSSASFLTSIPTPRTPADTSRSYSCKSLAIETLARTVEDENHRCVGLRSSEVTKNNCDVIQTNDVPMKVTQGQYNVNVTQAKLSLSDNAGVTPQDHYDAMPSDDVKTTLPNYTDVTLSNHANAVPTENVNKTRINAMSSQACVTPFDTNLTPSGTNRTPTVAVDLTSLHGVDLLRRILLRSDDQRILEVSSDLSSRMDCRITFL